MYIPKNFNQVTVFRQKNYAPHIPFGFLDFQEKTDGAGDYYGLYWAFGRENSEPIVCWFEHEQSLIEISHENLDTFLIENEIIEGDNDLINFSIELGRCKVKAQKGDFENAITKLKGYLSYVPEHSEAWGILADIYKRMGKIDEYETTSLKSILANWSFGLPKQKSIQMFKNINKNGILANDPLIKRLDNIELSFEFNKTVVSYNVLKEVINEYFERGDYVNALILEHNYALMMYFETDTFQKQHNFKLEKWQSEYEIKCKTYLNRSFDWVITNRASFD